MRAASAILMVGLAMTGCTGAAESVVNGPLVAVVRVSEVDTLATMSFGTGLDVAPDGTVYAVDGARNVVVVWSTSGLRIEGGSGAESGQFDGPTDVDAGNGLVIHVAEGGNRRVQRFSREFRHLGTISVGIRAFLPLGNGSSTTNVREADGRPLGVATASANELYVIDEVERAVLRWDENGRPDRVIGSFGSGPGQLQQPVALVTDGDRHLYVADATAGHVVVFDLVGTFVGRLLIPNGDTPVNVSYAPATGLLVVSSRRIYVFRDLQPVYGIEGLPGPIVDAARHGPDLFLLTRHALLRARWPFGDGY